MSWDQVTSEYGQYFNQNTDDVSTLKGGLQCKYYRVLESHRVDKVRKQTRSGGLTGEASNGSYGLLDKVNCNYPWIREA